MTRRGLVLGTIVVWAALVIGGCIWLNQRIHSDTSRGHDDVRALRAMPANHRVENVDLEIDTSARDMEELPKVRDLLGRYLVHAKHQGETITPKDVTELPSLVFGSTQEAILIYQLEKPQSALAELLDAGDWIRVCAPRSSTAPRPCHPDPLQVLAVHPAGQAGADAWLMLSVPTAEATTVHGYFTARGRYPIAVQAPGQA
jgi:hypothetical protein